MIAKSTGEPIRALPHGEDDDEETSDLFSSTLIKIETDFSVLLFCMSYVLQTFLTFGLGVFVSFFI